MQTTETYIEIERLYKQLRGTDAKVWRLNTETVALRSSKSTAEFTGSEDQALAYLSGLLQGLREAFRAAYVETLTASITDASGKTWQGGTKRGDHIRYDISKAAMAYGIDLDLEQ